MEIIRNFLKRKFRNFLTIFGITIGIFTLIVMGSMAEKMNRLMVGATNFLENRITITYEEAGSGLFGISIIPEYIADEISKVEGVKLVNKEIGLLFDEELGGISFGMMEMIYGVNITDYLQAEQYMRKELIGTFFAGDWWKEGDKNIAVLGFDISKKLDVGIGDIVINRENEFKVIGILNRTMTGSDNMMFIDIDDARELLLKTQPILKHIDIDDYVNSMVAITDAQDIELVATRIMEEVPGIIATPPGKIIEEIKMGLVVFNLIIIASALIALVVGGLSVINTMLMSVTERVREIGIKKAIGARDIDILKEYILEASLIGLLAGLIGLGLGIIFVSIINALTFEVGTTIFLLTPRLAIGAVLFALIISILAGLLPAYQAVRINPIKALKSE